MATKSELIAALEMIEREKGIKKDDLLKMIESALVSSLRKHLGKNAVIEATIDPVTAEFGACAIKKTVEHVADPELEISLQEAKRYSKNAALGDSVRIPAPVTDFARIAAQTAKQVLTQKFREAERNTLYDQFKPREGEILNGSVHRFMERNVIIDLGKTEAILPVREQIRRERYAIGQNVRAVILRVDKAQNVPQIVLSRAAPLFLRKLLELEVPEISDKIVEVVDVTRDPGFRAKISVKSNDPKIDPVGSCVGLRGSRVRSIMNELAGEKIDLIPYHEDPAAYIANALSPAHVSSIQMIDAQSRKAQALVSEDQMAAALGKDGQNLRLASRLTGWSIELKAIPSSPKADTSDAGASFKNDGAAKDNPGLLEGVGPKTAEILSQAGFSSIEKLAACKVEDLTALQGIGEKTAARIIANAQSRLKDLKSS